MRHTTLKYDLLFHTGLPYLRLQFRDFARTKRKMQLYFLKNIRNSFPKLFQSLDKRPMLFIGCPRCWVEKMPYARFKRIRIYLCLIDLLHLRKHDVNPLFRHTEILDEFSFNERNLYDNMRMERQRYPYKTRINPTVKEECPFRLFQRIPTMRVKWNRLMIVNNLRDISRITDASILKGNY